MKQIFVVRIMMLLVLAISAIGIGTGMTVQQHADASWGCYAHPVLGGGCIGSGNGPFDTNHDPDDGGGSSDDN